MKRRTGYLLVVAAVLLCCLLTGCKDEPTGEGGGEPESSVPNKEQAPQTTKDASAQTAPEDAFLAEIERITPVLGQDAPPAKILQAVKVHLDSRASEIDAAVEALSKKREGMSGEEREAFEDQLSGRAEVSAFFDAMESFRSKATPAQMDALDALFSQILPEE